MHCAECQRADARPNLMNACFGDAASVRSNRAIEVCCSTIYFSST